MTDTIPYSDHKAKEIRFQNVLEVVAYLKDAGYKIEKSKAYIDRHLMKPDKDGFLQSNVDRYAKAFLERFDGTSGDGNSDKAREEARLTRERADKIAFENEIMRGKYLLRSEVDRQFAARAAFLKDGVGPRFIHSRAPRIVEMVGGEMAKIPDLVEMWLKEVEELFDHYSRPLEFEAVNILTTEGTEDTE